ncbi:MAG: hypothetical protein LRY27_03825 [Chitinophagales bacterium]|nr:hypothetical protein [Chitinophagales bacterium]
MKKAITIILFLGLFLFNAQAQRGQNQEAELEAKIENLMAKLNDVVNDFPNNFVNIKSTEKTESGDYLSTIQLEFSEECYLSKKFMSDKQNFVGSFGSYENPEDAQNVFDNLEMIIEGTPFSFTLVKKELNSEVEDMSYWLPFDLNSDKFNEW